MPRIRTTGIPTETLLAIQEDLFAELEAVLQVPRAHLVLLAGGDIPLPEPGQEVTPFVEVAWFDRGLETQDRVAEVLTRRLKAAGCAAPDVVFLTLQRRTYYEDGVPF